MTEEERRRAERVKEKLNNYGRTARSASGDIAQRVNENINAFGTAKRTNLSDLASRGSSLVQSVQKKSKSWFDEKEHTRTSDLIGKQLQEVKNWRRYNGGNAQLDQIEKALTEAQTYWDSQRKYYSQLDAWQGKPRDEETVKSAIAEINAQMDEIRRGSYWKTQGAPASQYGAMLSQSKAEGSGGNPQLEELKKQRELAEQELSWSQYLRYDALREASDFDSRSAYKSTETGTGDRELARARGLYTDELSGWKDPVYEAVNGNEAAQAWLRDRAGVNGELGKDLYGRSELSKMTMNEVGIYNYLYSDSPEKAQEYLTYLTPTLNGRQRREESEAAAEFAGQNGWTGAAATAFTIAASPLKTITAFGQAVDYLADGEIDQNAAYNRFSYLPNAARQAVQENVEEKWGAVGGFVYGTSVSILENLMRAGIASGIGGAGGQAVSLLLMDTGAMADTVISGMDRGLDSNQAVTLGVIAGAAEIITEKISLEKLLNPKILAEGAGRYILKNMVAEGSEELASGLINLVADILVAGDKSEWQMAVAEYMAEGYDEKTAMGMAVKDKALELGMDFLGGAVSGGVLSTGNAAIQGARNREIAQFVGKQKLDREDIWAFVQEGLESDPESESHILAARMEEQLNRGQTPTDMELSKLYQANMAQQPETSIEEEPAQKAPAAAETPKTEAKPLQLMEAFRREGQAKEGYDRAVQLAYDIGKENGAQKALTSPAMGILTEDQKEMAYRMGQEDGEHISPENMGRQYLAYYNAGFSGQGVEAVQGKVTDLAQKAWDRGKRDAAASLEKGKTTAFASQGKEAKVVDSPAARSLQKANPAAYAATVQLSRDMGVNILIADMPDEVNGSIQDGVVRVNANALTGERRQYTVARILAHEVTHRFKEAAPEEYAAYRNFVMEKNAQIGGGNLENVVRDYQQRYAKVKQLTNEEALDELAADYTQEFLQDTKAFQAFLQEEDNRGWVRRILDWFKEVVQKLRNQDSQVAKEANQALELWEKAYRETKKAVKKAPAMGGTTDNINYSIDGNYAAEIQMWYSSGMPSGGEFTLGSTGPVLQGLGAIESDIFIYGDKIKTILENHPEMGIEEIKKIPHILEDPVLILKSENASRVKNNSRMVLFGSIKAKDGRPIMCVLDLLPVENGLVLDDMQKVVSAYSKDSNPVEFVRKSEVMYADKKRTTALLSSIGFTMPGGLLRSGYIGNISYSGGKVNLLGERFTKISPAEAKYSLSGTEDIFYENARRQAAEQGAREQISFMRKYIASTSIRNVTDGEADSIARKLLWNWGADMEEADLRQDIRSLYDQITKDPEADPFATALEIGKKIAGNLTEVDGDVYKEYADLRRHLRDTRIYVSPEIRDSIPDYYDTVRHYRGRLRLTTRAGENGGTISLEEAYKDMAKQWPELFPVDADTGDSQVLAMIEATNLVYGRGAERFIEGQELENAAAMIAADLLQMSEELELFKAVAQVRKEAQLAGQMAQGRIDAKTIRKTREQLARLRESKEAQSQSRSRTAMRNKIRTVAKQLNDYLLKGTKDHHVPIGLQKNVAEVLEAVNMDTVEAEARIASLQAELAAATTDKQRMDITRRITHLQEMLSGGWKRRLTELKEAYQEILKSDDPLIASAYDEVIAQTLEEVQKLVGDTALRSMTTEQLQAVYDLYKSMLTRIRKANKAFKAGQAETIQKMGQQVLSEMDSQKKRRTIQIPGGKTIDTVGWNNEKPVYAFSRIGSGTLAKLFDHVRDGEDVWAVDVSEAKAFAQDTAKKYGMKQWDSEERHTFRSTTGKEFSLDLGQIMSLYAYSRREQAEGHLRDGGFVFAPDTPAVVKVKGKIKVKVNLEDANPYNLDTETLANIVGVLTPEQKAYVEAMQDYLSTVMGGKGNEVSLAMYGIKLFKEKHYFPLKSAKAFMAQEKQKADGEVKIKNKGFTKGPVPKANNPVVLDSFLNVWADHVNEMSMYHAFTLPLEDFYRVRNYHTPNEAGTDSRSVVNAIEEVHGAAATAYIEQLLKDLNGGAVNDPRETPFKALNAKFKKNAVMGSLSVVIQQPTAIIRAMSEIDARHFAPLPISRGVIRTVNAKKHRRLMAELKKYAPVAIIKEMGYFDTNMGRSARDYIQGQEYEGLLEKTGAFFTDGSFRDEVFGKLPGLADEMGWVSIWEAVKREQLYQHKDLAPNSEEFLTLCGKRFTEVIVKTQVYDSVLSRSANMRAKGGLMNMAMAFMAEPTTSINMLEDALRKGRTQGKQGIKQMLKTFGAVYGSVILNAALVSLVYAARDDDEDETYAEKYLARLATEILEGLNPITYLPILKDIWSIAQGYDVERADMSLWADLVDSLRGAYTTLAKDTEDMSEEELKAHEKKVLETLLGMADGITALWPGLPVRNVRRDINGAFNLFDTLTKDANGRKTTAGSLMDVLRDEVQRATPIWGWGKTKGRGEKLYDAMKAGDKEYVERLKDRYKDDSAFHSAVRTALRDNDPRIRAAAMALLEGNTENRIAISKEVIADGFTQDDVIAAVNAEANSLKTEEKEATQPKKKGFYTAEDFANAIGKNNADLAKKAMLGILETEKANGDSEHQAMESFKTAAKGALKELYLAGKLSAGQAQAALEDYLEAYPEDAESSRLQWDFEKKYDIPWTEKKTAYFDGDMTRAQVKNALMTYGQQEEDEAERTMKEYDFEKKHGIPWDDKGKAYRNGRLSKSVLEKGLMEISEQSEEEAEYTIKAYDWQRDYPSCPDISAEAVKDYEEFCYGAPKTEYYKAWKYTNATEGDKDENGETIKNSKTKKVLAYIDTLALTSAEKTAIAEAFYKASTVRRYKPWR